MTAERPLLHSRALAPELMWRASCASTNSELVARAAEASDLTVLATDTQTAGRGRLDRAWSTPAESALAVSVFVAHGEGALDPQRLGWLPLIAGVAMTRAVRSFGTPTVRRAGLKWPNDVLIAGRKISGILTELTPHGVVVGAGLNLTMTENELPVATATSLVIEGVDRAGAAHAGADEDADAAPDLVDVALAAYLRELVPLVQAWREASAMSTLRELVEPYLQTIGLAVRVDRPGLPVLRGAAEGLDDDGRLIVRSGEAGSPLVAVAAGDVTHLRYE